MVQPKTKTPNRYAVVVMGMHRSGTSALAGVLARLGCDTPKDLMEAKPMNAKGFYESDTISHLNEALMQSAGSSWFTWQAFNQSWFDSPKAAEFAQRALDSLTESYDKSSLMVLKDPRMCLLVPFWEDVFPVAGYTPKYFHIHRHPLEVAQSLNKWAGYDPEYSQLLWLRYVLEAELSTRGKSRFFTSYKHVMENWVTVTVRSSELLGLTWPRSSDHTNAEITAFLDDKLHHMRTQNLQAHEDLHLIPVVSDVFDIMERWAESGETNADWDRLDSIRDQFNSAAPVFSSVVEAGRRDSLALQVKEQEAKQSATLIQDLQAEGMALRSAAEQSATLIQDLQAEGMALQSAAEQALKQHQDALQQLKNHHAQATQAAKSEAKSERDAFLRQLRNDKIAHKREAQEKLSVTLRELHMTTGAIHKEKDIAIEAAESKVQGLLNSTSWRVTAPLRRIMIASRKLRS